MRMIPMLVLSLALAACGGQSIDNVVTPAKPGPSDFQKQVAALDDSGRNAVFIRAIRDAGFDCQGVTKSVARGEGPAGDPLWHATCSGGATYGVLIGREGTATVVGAE